MERDDRRYFVIEMPEKREQEFYDRLVAWRDGDGPASLMQKLLEVDLEDYNPSAEAPCTEHKETMRRDALTSLGEWLQDMLFDGPVVCGGAENKCDLWTTDQLKTWFEAATGAKTTHKYVGQDLSRLGAKQVHRGRQIKSLTTTIAKARLWAIRDQAKWERADLDQIRDHFQKHHASIEALGKVDS
jgi:nicotinamidase-related amidase